MSLFARLIIMVFLLIYYLFILRNAMLFNAVILLVIYLHLYIFVISYLKILLSVVLYANVLIVYFGIVICCVAPRTIMNVELYQIKCTIISE